METNSGKPLDTRLVGVKCDDECAGKIDVVMRGVQDLCDRVDKLNRRLDAFEESEKGGWWRDAR